MPTVFSFSKNIFIVPHLLGLVFSLMEARSRCVNRQHSPVRLKFMCTGYPGPGTSNKVGLCLKLQSAQTHFSGRLGLLDREENGKPTKIN